MVRNIPVRYKEKHLEKELGILKGKYDCIYMPYDFENDANKGYAFINLIHPLHILYLYELFHCKTWQYFASFKVCELNYAKNQGIKEITNLAMSYDKKRKPNFYDCSEANSNPIIEVPMKYYNKIRTQFPNLKLEIIEKNRLFGVNKNDYDKLAKLSNNK